MVKLVHISNYHSVAPERNGHISFQTGEKARVGEMIAVEKGYIKQTWLQVWGFLVVFWGFFEFFGVF